MDSTKIKAAVERTLVGVELDTNLKQLIVSSVTSEVGNQFGTQSLKERLAVRFEYEKHYLDLLKSHKEEIKFAASLQEDLRKERAKFFAETLREVSKTLSDAQVAPEVASNWLKELVDSYTASLNVSSGLVEEHTLDTIGQIRSATRQDINGIDGDGK